MPATDDLLLAPSMVSAPMDALAEVLASLEAAGADILHFDVEDGHFMPAIINLGTRIIGELRPLSDLPFDVHLMVENPEAIIPVVLEAGANMVSVHAEACPYPRRTLELIKRGGAQAGLAFNPKTPLFDLTYLLPHLDYVNVLTTEPELPNWPFLPPMLDKLRALSVILETDEADVSIQVDGGIDEDNIGAAAAAGARLIVAGRSAFQGGQIEANLQRLRAAAEASLSNPSP